MLLSEMRLKITAAINHFQMRKMMPCFFGNVIATSIHVWLYWQRNTYAYHQAVLQWSQCFLQQGSY